MNARKGAAVAAALFVLAPVLAVVMLGGNDADDDPCRQALTAANSPLRVGMLTSAVSVPGYDDEQIANAAAIVRAGADLGMSRRDQTIGVMVAIGESTLRALDYGDEAGADSRGLFQQRDNGAWGTYADRMDPYTSATNFFKALGGVSDRDSMAPTLVGHAVQGNRDPYHYESSWEAAQEIMDALDAAGQIGAGGPAPTAAAQEEAAPAAAPSASAAPAGADVVATARAQLGLPYVVGGSDPQGGFDCSGLIQYVFAQAGISLPRTAAQQGGAGEEVWSGAGASAPFDALRPGDIIYFPGGGDYYDHVALYIGDRTVIHAPDIGSVVSEARVDDAYWGARQWSVRRIDAATAAASAASPARTGSRVPAGCPDDRLLLTKSLGSSTAPLTPGGWAPPAAGPITSDYGMRVNPVDGGLRLHAGTDLGGGGCGGPIYAAHDGTVTLAGMDEDVGSVEIDHGGGIATAYLHMYPNDIYVHAGDKVRAGQQIALVGNTGNSTGCHLHFEVHVNDGTVDPAPFMQERGVDLNGEPVGADGGISGW